MALLTRFALPGVFGLLAPLLPFVLAIVLSAWAGGRRAGYVATALSVLAIMWFFVEPRGSFLPRDPYALAAIAFFSITGTLVAMLVGSLREALAASAAAERAVRDQIRLVDLSHDAIITTNADRRISGWNLGAAELYGYTEAEASGRCTTDLLRTRGDLSIADIDQILFRSDRWEGELEHTARDGRRVRVESRQVLLRDEQQRIKGILEINRDITERARAERELQESERKYRTIFDAAAIGIGRVRFTDARWIDVNDAFCRMIGNTREELLAKPWPEITHPEDIDVDLIPLSRMAAGELETYTIEKRLMHKRGHAVWARVTLSLVRDAAGNPDYEIAIIEDITSRKQAEQALRESEERLSLAIASTGLGTFDYNPQTGKLIWDETAKRHFGLSAGAEVDYETFLRGLHPDDRERVDQTIKDVLKPASGGEYATEYRTIGLEDHKERWLSAWGRVLFDSAGLAARFIGVTLDITERKRTEDALRDSERRLRELADAMPQLVWIADASGAINYVNRQWYEQIGLPPEAAYAEGWAQVLHSEDRERVLSEWHRSVESGRRFELEYRLRTAGGEYRWFLGRSVPTRDEKGRITQWFGTATDIDETKRAEERLRQTQKLESIGLLAGGIAHDFNNLLTGIIGNASLVLEERTEGNRERRIQGIIHSAERAATLTRQLLAYSGKGQFIIKDVNISDAVRDIAELVQFSIPKSVALEINVGRRLPAVQIDPSQLQQILMNLVINAGEAIGEGNTGTVTVSTALTRIERPFVDAIGQQVEPGAYACIGVHDTGPGIDLDELPKIFDPFFTTKFTGRGLGLAAVAGIVRSQKGAIIVESEPGRGTTFSVYLPIAGAEPRPEEGAPAAGGAATVLVADDDADVRNVISAALRRKGYRVLTAADGQEALSIAEREPGRIDAAVLEVVMPIMGAEQVLPALTAKRPGMKILLTSGYSEADAMRLRAAYRGSAFIQKPYTVQQILKAVEDLLPDRQRS